MLAGRASWEDVDGALAREAAFLERFARDQAVQTNEVRRAWGLLPAFLKIGVPEIDLVELGSSGGLLLALDRYDYAYGADTWGPGDRRLELGGENRGGPPSPLLQRSLHVSRRIGLDLNPVPLDEHGARLLEAFVWADQDERIARLRRAIQVARDCEIELRAGDYVDLLPDVLEQRREGALMVVFDSVSTVYLTAEREQELRRVLAGGGAAGPLAWISFEGPRDDPGYGGVALDLTVWPGGETRRLAKVDFHAAWLDWLER